MPSERLPCRNKRCKRTILPRTARDTNGYCWPCIYEREEKTERQYIRRNHRVVDPYEGVTDPVEIIRLIYTPRHSNKLTTYRSPPKTYQELYSELTLPQAERVM